MMAFRVIVTIAAVSICITHATARGSDGSMTVETVPGVFIRDRGQHGETFFWVHYLCGEIEASSTAPTQGRPLAPGSYRTVITVTHPGFDGPLTLIMSTNRTASLGGEPGPAKWGLAFSLRPAKSVLIDCARIEQLLGHEFPEFAAGFGLNREKLSYGATFGAMAPARLIMSWPHANPLCQTLR